MYSTFGSSRLPVIWVVSSSRRSRALPLAPAAPGLAAAPCAPAALAFAEAADADGPDAPDAGAPEVALVAEDGVVAGAAAFEAALLATPGAASSGVVGADVFTRGSRS